MISEDVPAADDDAGDLQERVRHLERENAYLRAIQRIEGRATLAVAQFIFLIFAGKGLTLSLQSWLQTFYEGRTVSIEATAHVIAALLRRVFKIGLIGFVLALLPTWLLWRQNILIQEQNVYFRDQTEKMREQIAVEEQNTRAVRRAQLLSTIYDPGPCTPPAPGEACPPLANVRSRAEAALALIQLDRAIGVEEVDLSRANLDGARLAGADLSRTRLQGARIRRADLESIDLGTARLNGADLTGSHLPGANLRGADLAEAVLAQTRLNEAADLSHATAQRADFDDAFLRTAQLDGADLRGASLRGADFLHATLRGTRLEGADLTGARHLDAADLAGATWDSRTRWPDGFDPSGAGAVLVR
ncbi:MAG: pentapeptide repeat-containing protein [Myxococcota bacterium]